MEAKAQKWIESERIDERIDPSEREKAMDGFCFLGVLAHLARHREESRHAAQVHGAHDVRGARVEDQHLLRLRADHQRAHAVGLVPHLSIIIIIIIISISISSSRQL